MQTSIYTKTESSIILNHYFMEHRILDGDFLTMQQRRHGTVVVLQRKNSKNPILLWKWVGGYRSHSEFFFGKSSQNSSIPELICWSSNTSIPCVFCLYSS